MTSPDIEAPVSSFQQPKAVWAVAFACVVSFMGIGLVDPVLSSPPTTASSRGHREGDRLT